MGGNPRNTVLKRSPYPLAFVGYSAWRRRRIGRRRRRRRKRRNLQTAKDVFYALAPFHLKERLAYVCVQRTLSTSLFHSPLLVSVESWRRFFIVLRYTNNHHHPYIDSTTVLSDYCVNIIIIHSTPELPSPLSYEIVESGRCALVSVCVRALDHHF